MVVVDNIVECECGQIHQLDPNGMSGCSWISCTCGKTICKTCGSGLIEEMEEDSDEDYLWCNRKCNSCGTIIKEITLENREKIK